MRYGMVLPPGQGIATGFTDRIALSPDGTRLVYVGESETGRSQLWVRRRDQLQATPLTGIEGVLTAPFFCPDGERVGFVAGVELKLASLSGGQPVPVTDTLVGISGASWGRDGFIYANVRGFSPLVRVRAAGGSPEWFTRLDSGHTAGVNSST